MTQNRQPTWKWRSIEMMTMHSEKGTPVQNGKYNFVLIHTAHVHKATITDSFLTTYTITAQNSDWDAVKFASATMYISVKMIVKSHRAQSSPIVYPMAITLATDQRTTFKLNWKRLCHW